VQQQYGIEYFTEVLKGKPKDMYALTTRAMLWKNAKGFDQALIDYDAIISLDPTNAGAFNDRGFVRASKNDHDRAIADYTEAIRLDPKLASAYHNRGVSWRAKKDIDRSIADDTEAIKLNPKYVEAYETRGDALREKNEFDRALADFDEVIQLGSRSSMAYLNRAVLRMITARDGAAEDARSCLGRIGWREDDSLYAILYSHFADRRAHRDDKARQVIDRAMTQANTAIWPFAFISHLHGDLDEEDLLDSVSKDPKQLSEAHTFLGLERLCAGNQADAIEHFRWVKQHANATSWNDKIALAELERLAEKPADTGP
jgi:tetratricopeptide (TPR) repeat protein